MLSINMGFCPTKITLRKMAIDAEIFTKVSIVGRSSAEGGRRVEDFLAELIYLAQ